MKILFYFGHPAQYLFARNSIKELIKNNHKVKLMIKTKDVLEELIKNDGFEYQNILPKERGKSKLSIALSLLKRHLILFPIILKFKPNLLIGEDTPIATIGKILNINRITILEDDYEIIKSYANITYPFTQTILTPTVCRVGEWESKKIAYRGYMKLGYLHPKIFQPDREIAKKYTTKDYVLIRLAKLTAFHDFGIKGIDTHILDRLIDILEKKSFQVLFSTEDTLDKKYNKYILNINPSEIHHLLANASMLICDSQSMSVEASMLGVPSLRVSSFVGKISVLEELEHKYHLTFGINPNNIEKLFDKLDELLSFEDLKEKFQMRREIMLKDKINVSNFFTWFIENYPKSIEIIRQEPNFQSRFK